MSGTGISKTVLSLVINGKRNLTREHIEALSNDFEVNPAAFLLTETQWAPRRDEYCQLVGKSADGTAALAAAEVELHAALADLDAQLAAGDPAGVRLNADGELIIPPLAGEDIPAEADMLRDELAGILPVVPIASLLVEVDARTGFT